MDRSITNLSPRAMELLVEYHYPGNIRELEHIIEHAFVRCHGKTIHPEHLPHDLQSSDVIDMAIHSDAPLKALEKETITRALNESDWHLQDCAKKLHISRTTLWRKMKKLDITKS